MLGAMTLGPWDSIKINFALLRHIVFHHSHSNWLYCSWNSDGHLIHNCGEEIFPSSAAELWPSLSSKRKGWSSVFHLLHSTPRQFAQLLTFHWQHLPVHKASKRCSCIMIQLLAIDGSSNDVDPLTLHQLYNLNLKRQHLLSPPTYPIRSLP